MKCVVKRIGRCVCFAVLLSLVCEMLLTQPTMALDDGTYSANDAMGLDEMSGKMYVNVVENPRTIDDGTDMYQLSESQLSKDTASLLRVVLNAEYINIARRNACLFSSDISFLQIRYWDFNGYIELLSRSDFVDVILGYVSELSVSEITTLMDMLQYSRTQSFLTREEMDIVSSAINDYLRTTYSIISQPGKNNFFGESTIDLIPSGEIIFVGGQRIAAYQTAREYTEEERLVTDGIVASMNMGVTLVYSADISYNCHSYAWYSMDNNNQYWIGIEKTMYIPNTATLIAFEDTQVRDIVVYRNQFGEILHSGVVYSLEDGELIVQSKWGTCGVYRHAIDNVPRAYLGDDGVLRYEIYRYHQCYRTTINLGHEFSMHVYEHIDACAICDYEKHTIVRTPCSGPPCAVPFGVNKDEEAEEK